MKNMRHPAFIIGIASIIILLIGVGLKAYGYASAYYVIIFSIILGAIHWIWSIIDVIGRTDMKPFQKRFWLIAVIAAPAIGGLLFYTLHQRKDRIVT
jgi:hypothetical protein